MTRATKLERLPALLAVLAACGAAQADPSVWEVSSISAGLLHSCAVNDGGAWCWGSNEHGQLGDGSILTTRSRPVVVSGLSDGVAKISAGVAHTCAITTEARVRCWGNNDYGQLGDGTTSTRLEPVDVQGLADPIEDLAAGYLHTCALTTAGGVWCWGGAGEDQLGSADAIAMEYSSTPIAVEGLPSGVVAIAAGAVHTCALTSQGETWCWGDDGSGQLGDGSGLSTSAPYLPVRAEMPHEVTQIAAGWEHTCAITVEAELWCWGLDYFGQLGNSVDEPGYRHPNGRPIVACVFVPLLIYGSITIYCVGEPGEDVKEHADSPTRADRVPGGVEGVTAGTSHTCAITSGGGATCWGFNGVINTYEDERLGDGSLVSGDGVTSITAGDSHTCVVIGTDAWCWGSNRYHQLGQGVPVSSARPIVVPGLPGAMTSIASGYQHNCAVAGDGEVWCWGSNSGGALGDGSNEPRDGAVVVAGLPDAAVSVAAGSTASCAVLEDGTVWCWGDNTALGDGSSGAHYTPVAVSGLPSAAVAVATKGHSCAVTVDGQVWCWGSNRNGQLGDGTTEDRLTPVAVIGLPSPAVAISMYYGTSCAITSDGGVWCWGANDDGQLGDGTTEDRSTAVAVSGLPAGAVSIAVGARHTCAVTDAGEAWCWGSNYHGQMGIGTTDDYGDPPRDPVRVTQLPQATAVSAKSSTSCALTAPSGAYCWGGHNPTFDIGSNRPIALDGFPQGAVEITEGYLHRCVLIDDGEVWCWGSNRKGQLLGKAYVEYSAAPLRVVPEPGLLVGMLVGVATLSGLSRRRSAKS